MGVVAFQQFVAFFFQSGYLVSKVLNQLVVLCVGKALAGIPDGIGVGFVYHLTVSDDLVRFLVSGPVEVVLSLLQIQLGLAFLVLLLQ